MQRKFESSFGFIDFIKCSAEVKWLLWFPVFFEARQPLVTECFHCMEKSSSKIICNFSKSRVFNKIYKKVKVFTIYDV